MPSEMSLWNDEAKPKMRVKSKFIGDEDDLPSNRYQDRRSTVQDIPRKEARAQAKNQKIKGGMLLQVKSAL